MADADAVFSALLRADVSARLGLSLLVPIVFDGVVAVSVKRSASTVAVAFAGVVLESTAPALPAGCSGVFDETGGSGMRDAGGPVFAAILVDFVALLARRAPRWARADDGFSVFHALADSL